MKNLIIIAENINTPKTAPHCERSMLRFFIKPGFTILLSRYSDKKQDSYDPEA